VTRCAAARVQPRAEVGAIDVLAVEPAALGTQSFLRQPTVPHRTDSWTELSPERDSRDVAAESRRGC
jgi:hypothetical protein